MIHTIKYTLPEERDELHLAVHGINYYLTLFDLDEYLRGEYKYNEDKYSGDEIDLLFNIRDKLRELMKKRNVSLDDVE